MMYCFNCGKFTTGDAFYCNYCGRSYDVKLCSRGHINPRAAEVCSRCGTRDLSTPQPPVPLRLRIVGFLVFLVGGAAGVIFVLIFGSWLITELLARQDVQRALLSLVFLGIALWLIWTTLPVWFRKFVYRLLQRRRRSREEDDE